MSFVSYVKGTRISSGFKFRKGLSGGGRSRRFKGKVTMKRGVKTKRFYV